MTDVTVMENVEAGAKAQQTTGAKAPEVSELETANTETKVDGEGKSQGQIDFENELAAIKATNARLLDENRKFKAQTKQAHEEKLKAEGKKDELIETLKQENDQIKLEMVASKLESMLADEGSKHGCLNHVHLYNNAREELNSIIQIDEETGIISGVKEFFDACKMDNEYSFYFKSVNPVRVDNKTPDLVTPFDYKKDPLAYLRQVKNKSPEKYNEEVMRLQREGLIQ